MHLSIWFGSLESDRETTDSILVQYTVCSTVDIGLHITWQTPRRTIKKFNLYNLNQDYAYWCTTLEPVRIILVQIMKIKFFNRSTWTVICSPCLPFFRLGIINSLSVNATVLRTGYTVLANHVEVNLVNSVF